MSMPRIRRGSGLAAHNGHAYEGVEEGDEEEEEEDDGAGVRGILTATDGKVRGEGRHRKSHGLQLVFEYLAVYLYITVGSLMA